MCRRGSPGVPSYKLAFLVMHIDRLLDVRRLLVLKVLSSRIHRSLYLEYCVLWLVHYGSNNSAFLLERRVPAWLYTCGNRPLVIAHRDPPHVKLRTCRGRTTRQPRLPNRVCILTRLPMCIWGETTPPCGCETSQGILSPINSLHEPYAWETIQRRDELSSRVPCQGKLKKKTGWRGVM